MRGLPALLAALLIAVPAAAQRNEAADRAAIHKLLVDYGATLDAGDFDGFGQLFGKSGVYVTGATEARGPQAAETMRKVFEANALGLPDPRFHIFFNEVVTFDGLDSAHATVMSLYMVPAEGGGARAAMMARYRDDLVREDGRWVFARRVVEGLM